MGYARQMRGQRRVESSRGLSVLLQHVTLSIGEAQLYCLARTVL
jgi:hypothetical protein